MGSVCYNPVKGIDDVICKYIGWSANRVATVRGRYDEAHPNNILDTSTPAKAAEELVEFEKEQILNRAKEIKSAGTNLSKFLFKLRSNFSALERQDRVNMIKEMFSQFIDAVQTTDPSLTRENIANGYLVNGEQVMGQFTIFEFLYHELTRGYETYVANDLMVEAGKIQKVLDNWSALITLVRKDLVNTEGLVLGNHVDFAKNLTTENYEDDDLADRYFPEESKRESWQEVADTRSSFGSIGQQVRRVLSSIQNTKEDGELDVDDLLFPRRLDPITAHQSLLSILEGVTSQDEMMEVLAASSKQNPWIKPLLPMLHTPNNRFIDSLTPEERADFTSSAQNHLLQTQFFLDFKKGFQLYSNITTKSENGILKYISKILNSPDEDSAVKQFLTRVNLNTVLNEKVSIYDKKGNINWVNTQKLITLITDQFINIQNINKENVPFTELAKQNKSKFFISNRRDKKQVLTTITQALGLDVSENTLENIIGNPNDLVKFTEQLTEIVTEGFNKNLINSEREKLKKNEKLDDRSYKSMLQHKSLASNAKEGVIQEKIRKALKITTKHSTFKRMESRVPYKDANGNRISLFSYVLPCYMSEKIQVIRNFANNNKGAALKSFLDEEYLNSSFFKYEGKILNTWLRDLYESENKDGIIDHKSFAATIQFKRALGLDDVNFENFGNKTDIITMMQEFFFAENDTDDKGRKYSWYPVFIMGDSGVSKYIKAKQYSSEEILEGMYETYQQELRRMALATEMNAKLIREGIENTGTPYQLLENFSTKTNEFVSLPFLNKDYKSVDNKVGKYADLLGEDPSKETVKNAIREYMKEGLQTFTEKLIESDVIQQRVTKDGTILTSHDLAQQINASTSLEKAIETYYENTKFATIQQLQMFTIDPSYYKGTKDLQKRYKEIHAPGNPVSVYARDRYGNYYAGERTIIDPITGQQVVVPNDIERCVYFEDVVVNGENTNSEFMEALLLNYGVADRAIILDEISKGITKPFEDESLESGRISKLKSLLGKNWTIYNKYQETSLTDGQGYRTLDSYRKVMGMSGLWNASMEKAYNMIKEIRTKYGIEATVSSEDLQKITDLAVVFQPIKPFLYTIENYAINTTDKIKIPVQHKYAEAVLIPELLQNGGKLKNMALWMEKNNIDLVGSTKIVKNGSFGATDISNISDESSLELQLSKGIVHQLSYNDYKIQTNVPEHINNSSLFPTQVRKLILGNINKLKSYNSYTNGVMPRLYSNSDNKIKNLTGENVTAWYNSLIMANILEDFDEFADDISTPEKLSQILIQNGIANNRESFNNLLAYSLKNGEFTVPLFEGAIEHDSIALIFSMFKKKVNKQKIRGGSLVQVSSMGITKEESEYLSYVRDPNNPNNILYAEVEVPFDLKYTDNNNREIPLKFEDWCNAKDGSLKKDKSGNILIEQKFPGILDMMGYRIPTEGNHSMMNLKIVKFSQKIEGGVIKVPPPALITSGFDFDIDKLFFMRYDLKQKQFTEDQVAKIWNKIYNNNDGEIKKALTDARDKNIKENDIISHIFRAYQNSALAQALEETNTIKDRLYKYWTEAGLKGTPESNFDEYVKSHSNEYLTFETYDYDKTPLDNIRVNRNNALLNIIQKRLSDPETFKSRYTPGGFFNASKSARIMRELIFGNITTIVNNGKVNFEELMSRTDRNTDPEPNYDPSEPMTRVIYNQQNQVAGKLIGTFANQNTNHVFASLMKTFKLKNPIKFGSRTQNGLADFLIAPDDVDVDQNMKEFLAASVDAVKDPVLNFLNFNRVTADSAAMLARLGYSTTEIGLLLNQPIIKELCLLIDNEHINVDEAIKRLVSKYNNYITLEQEIDSEIEFSTNRLASNIISDRKYKESKKDSMQNTEFATNQMKVLGLFTTIKDASIDLTQLITATKFTASNAVGSTAGHLYAQQMKVKQYLNRFVKDKNNKNKLNVIMEVAENIERPIDDNLELLEKTNQDYIEGLIKNPFGCEQVMFDTNRKILRILKPYVPYETNLYTDIRTRLASLTKNGVLDSDTINDLHSNTLVYLLSQKEGGEFYGDGQHIDKDGQTLTNREYYTNFFPKELFGFLENNPAFKKTYPILEFMLFETEDAENANVTIRIQDIGGLNKSYQKESLIESWAELMKEYPLIAKDIFMYNFYKLGFTFSPLSFMNLAPTELKETIVVSKEYNPETENFDIPLTYVDFLRAIEKSKEVVFDVDDLAKQYILNHLDNYNLVYTIKTVGQSDKSVYGTYLKESFDKFKVPSNFTVNISDSNLISETVLINDPNANSENGDFAFKPVIIISNPTTGDEHIYVASGNGNKFNYGLNGKMTYTRVNPQGVKNKSLRYKKSSESLSTNTIVPNSFPTNNTSVESDYIEQVTPINKQAIIDEIIDAVVKNNIAKGDIMFEEIAERKLELQNIINSSSDEDLRDTINAIRKESIKNGVVDKVTNNKIC